MFPPATPTPPTTGSTPPATPPATPEYLTKEEFSRSAAYIRGLSEKLDSLTKSVPTMDLFVTLGLIEKDGDTYKPKTAAAPAPQPKPAGIQPDPVVEMEARFQSELKKRDDALAAERRKAADTEQRGAMVEALTKAGAVNAGRDVVHMSGVVKNASGQFVQVVKDQFGADTEVPLEQAAANFLKTNPELKRASGHPGSGTPNGSFQAGSQGKDTGSIASMSTEEYFAARKSGKI